MMKLIDYPDGAAQKVVAEHFDKYPYLEARFGEVDVFSSAIVRQPHLKSSYTNKEDEGKSLFEVVSLYYKGAHVGSLSFFLERNDMKKEGADHFVRIDIVVVGEKFQKKAAGKLLVVTAIHYVLRRWGDRIYSLSCLAAHEAMARILEDVGFQGEQRENEEFVRETFSLNDETRDDFSALIDMRLGEAIQLVNYRLR